MYHHTELGNSAEERGKRVRSLIRTGGVTLGGHRPSKIYGLLTCKAGKRMKPDNRMFFRDEQEALVAGYRPCGACLPEKYKVWKQQTADNARTGFSADDAHRNFVL
ncbi:MAG TPA: Ada metal-binding domain-containing protein [Chitinophaga sp.]|uniref:Ada metal-binding domain-containing protein n=1 Tax=Chitinophaga sp. TaxID=1869181 RepID=UPI002C33E9AE|nr:Ada metal-binding domain-containing protein [Chitinophaga sp.]HVI48732.1 Ada metal-binding domain-containing protein [Chitinophaga sp.]